MPRRKVSEMRILNRAIGKLASLAPDGVKRRLLAIERKIWKAITQ